MSRNRNPTAFYSSKLTTAKINDTTKERELLSIAENLTVLTSILRYCITVYIEHKNLVYNNFRMERVI